MKTQTTGIIVLGYGAQPISFIGNSVKLIGDHAILDQDVARMAGANFAFGDAGVIDKLRALLIDGAIAEQQKETPGLSIEAINWLATGRRGISSNTMFTVLTGVDALNGSSGSHPLDPDDLHRCIDLLKSVPELRQDLHKMAEHSLQWAGLIANWEEIERCFLDEVRAGGTGGCNGERTYALMKKAIYGSKDDV